MLSEENLSLDCPYCGEALYRPLAWFRKTYATCPACDRGLTAAQFAGELEAIEAAFDARIEEHLLGGPAAGGGCGGGCRH